ncbi:MAG TPA: twin-arginine translocase subunit TatC, partial [Anaerolineaceae bacterium]|nr:twin-arginine translocase subunit TatC [Anaerolineaceae bacterium]
MAQGKDATMPILEHLEELRKRLLISVGVLLVATILSFAFTDRFIEVLTLPIGGLESLVSIEVTENISMFMRVALLSGVILAMPVIVYELLMFILPGLTPAEKRWIYFGVPMASILFLCGVLFTYFVMLPTAIPFLLNFLGVKTTPRLSNYISFVTNMMFWIGLSFELPLLAFLLAKLRVISGKLLARGWRIAIIVIAVVAAVVTPTPDVVNMS